MASGKINRRDFLKIGGAAVTAASLAPTTVFGGAKDDFFYDAVTRNSRLRLPGIPTTCNVCSAGCGQIVYRFGSRITTILGNPLHPVNKGRLCAAGAAGKALYNDPFRLTKPLTRNGPRGSGKWKEISWSEALEVISRAFRKSILKREGETDIYAPFAFETNHLHRHLLPGRFAKALSEKDEILGKYVRSIVPARKSGLQAAMNSMFGAETRDHAIDIDELKGGTLIVFGADPLGKTENFAFSKELADAAAKNEITLVTIDPRFSATAAKSHVWIPVKPGTDLVLALSIAHLLVKVHGLGTDLPGMPREQLWRNLAQYRPDWSARRCGISPLEIRKLALRAVRGPSAVLTGSGVAGQADGYQASKACMILDLLLGGKSLRRKSLPRFRYSDSPWHESVLVEAGEGKKEIGVYMAAGFNPAYDGWKVHEIRKALEGRGGGKGSPVRLAVTIDTHLTETAELSDIVLPAATYFESWGLKWVRGPGARPVLTLTRPVMAPVAEYDRLRRKDRNENNFFDQQLKPLGEAKSVDDFILTLVQKTDMIDTELFPAPDIISYIKDELENIPGLHAYDFNALQRRGFFILREAPLAESPLKAEIYSVDARLSGEAPFPAVSTRGKSRPGQLLLVAFSPGVHTSRTAANKWLEEISHDTPAWMNPVTAGEMGLHEGEQVILRIMDGDTPISASTRIKITEGLVPGAVAIARHAGHTGFSPLARAEDVRTKDPDTSRIWWKEQSNGLNVAEIMPGTDSGSVSATPWTTAVPVSVTRHKET